MCELTFNRKKVKFFFRETSLTKKSNYKLPNFIINKDFSLET